MAASNPALADELLAMAQRDADVWQRLVENRQLFDGYHRDMEAVHRENGRRLAEIIDQYGFPGTSLVGEEGAHAAWITLQHAIGMPDLQRASLPLLRDLATRDEMPWACVAMLEDRIRSFEGKRQRYGTQFDWDERGELSPLPIEDMRAVDALRADVGLPPLASAIQQQRENARVHNLNPHKDRVKKEQERQEWLNRVGWRR